MQSLFCISSDKINYKMQTQFHCFLFLQMFISVFWRLCIRVSPTLIFVLSAVCDVMFLSYSSGSRKEMLTDNIIQVQLTSLAQTDQCFKHYSFQTNIWIDHLKASIHIKACKQYFNRINDPSFSCFIPQGEAKTHPTHDTPRTGSTDSSSCSGGKQGFVP